MLFYLYFPHMYNLVFVTKFFREKQEDMGQTLSSQSHV